MVQGLILFLCLWNNSVEAFILSSTPKIVLRKRYRHLSASSPSEEENEADQSDRHNPFDFHHASSLTRDAIQTTLSDGLEAMNTAQTAADEAVNTVQTAADDAWSSVNELASQGTSNVKSAAQATGSTIAELAESASANLFGLAQQGTAQATEFVQWLDLQVKEGATATNSKAKEMVLAFTGKSEYEFGDITKTVLHKAQSTDVDIRDIMLLLKVLIVLGGTVAPLAKLLPVTVLLEGLNVSLETRLGGKIIEALAGALDERLLKALSADELGDAAKRSLTIAITAFTGKATYEKGDIEQAVKRGETAATAAENSSSAAVMRYPTLPPPTAKPITLMVEPEFAEWDKQYLKESTSASDLDSAVEDSLPGNIRKGY